LADRHAKNALLAHEQPSAAIIARLIDTKDKTERLIRYAVDALLMFPKHEKCSDRTAPKAHTQKLTTKHQVVIVDVGWQCSICLKVATTRAGWGRLQKSGCAGFNTALRKLLYQPQNHNIRWTATHAQPIAYCIRCGAWATRKPVNLYKPCVGTVLPAAKHGLSRIQQGFHPLKQLCLTNDEHWHFDGHQVRVAR
jgi:hypothetical protein